SHHLYSSERVYLRELLQNARDAIEARRRLDPALVPAIEVVPSENFAPMVVRDNEIGLTDAEMRSLLATIGGSSKRDDFAVARRKFLCQFGIGLLS
ncbi:MAG: HSP90 family protein, partial [Dermatophilaceae bacterium]